MESKRGARAVIVGGSTAGLSCAHALIAAGWGVTVIEKSTSPPSGSITGAGLGLGPQLRDLLARWVGGGGPDVVRGSSSPLSIDLNRAIDDEKKISLTLAWDDNFNFRAAHWTDLYSILYNALPSEIILWGHQFHSFQISHDKSTVTIKARVAKLVRLLKLSVICWLLQMGACLQSVEISFLISN